MATCLFKLYLARHGDTAWTESHRHTGRTDLPLNERGEAHAARLGESLRGLAFARVLTSPLRRAAKTCALAGFGAAARVDPDLAEWDYGRYEGRRTSEVVQERPGWELYRDGCPGGESPDDVAARADRFLARLHGAGDDVLAFSSGHAIPMIAARWLGLPPAAPSPAAPAASACSASNTTAPTSRSSGCGTTTARRACERPGLLPEV
jgi:broad specificity phosphatase PhoE